MMITTRFPNATVNSQAAWHIAFMLIGAWRKRGEERGERGRRE